MEFDDAVSRDPDYANKAWQESENQEEFNVRRPDLEEAVKEMEEETLGLREDLDEVNQRPLRRRAVLWPRRHLWASTRYVNRVL